MTSLMSIFDPSMSSFLPKSGWCAVTLSVFFMKSIFWQSPSSLVYSFKQLLITLLSLFNMQKLIFVALFMYILNMNVLGMLPLIFSPTSHLSFNIILSLIFWTGVMLWYLYNNGKQFLSHLTPVGSPLVLAPALVLIELVSSLIRPLTLSLRLMANVMAGHMILTLVSKGVFSLSVLIKIPLFLVLVGFFMFEFGVALIQSYVFSSLMFLYWEESEKSH